jgi:thioester reductase-like protein
MNFLLTGSTGALGAEVLGRLARAQPNARLHVLLRAQSDSEFTIRSAALLGSVGDAVRSRIVPVAGDVTSPRLGLGAQYDELAGELDEIYHLAACTRFDVSAEVAAEHNIRGTHRVLALARAARHAGRSGRVHYVSTAYVSGRRTGTVTESDLDCGQEFFNAYEWSKFRAECDVRAAGRTLPVTIYRPSVVVGNSQTGWAARFLGVYQVLRWIDRGQLKTLPCRADFELDLVPADYVAEAIVRLAGHAGSVGQTFHLTAGEGNLLPLEELIDIFLRERLTHGGLSMSSVEPPRFTPPDADAGLRSRRLGPYVPYLTCPKAFDDGNARAMLNGYGAAPCREFFPRVARYALDADFGAA